MALTLALSLLGNLVVALFILVCAALILIILLQKGRGGGLGAAFGGGGAGSLLGTKTGDFLTWVTIALVAGFLVLAVLMAKFMRPSGSSSTLSMPMAPAAPIETPAPDVAPVAGEAVDIPTETVDVTVDEALETTEAVDPEFQIDPEPAQEAAEPPSN
jgi:preprotein translocase subunit SecG